MLKPRIGYNCFKQGLRFFHTILQNTLHSFRYYSNFTSENLTSFSDSNKIWSYSLKATRNMMEVTFSKQWIHFLLSDLCPPTSTILQNNCMWTIWKKKWKKNFSHLPPNCSLNTTQKVVGKNLEKGNLKIRCIKKKCVKHMISD